MLTFDLKTLIFVFILLVLAVATVVYWLARQRPHAVASLSGDDALLSMLDDAPFGIVVLEGDDFRYANPYARRLLHLPGVAGPLPSADWSPLLEADRAAARYDVPATGRYRSVTFASGQTARWWVAPRDDAEQDRTGLVLSDFLFLLDVTAQQRTEQAGRALINDLGHELRTPIATILTHLEILGLSDIGDDVRQQSLALSKDEAQRMARLLNDMLELGRLETSQELPRRPVDLVALVEDVVLQSMPRASALGMALSLEAGAPLPFVSANADRLRQVFLNLLDNALKYARSGDRVIISLQQTQEGVACAVCDTGPGIQPEHLPHVTRRFYRAAPQSVEGSGLGLALVAEILRRHESELAIESPVAEGAGTCAKFTIREA